jgi:uncharacterized membrane protein YcfT
VQLKITSRVAWIDAARGLAILLVVVIHATQWIELTPIRIPGWDGVNEVLSTLRMPLFFMCAGILATKWLSASWADLVSRKVFFLFWVYLLWQPIGSLAAVVAARITGDQLTPLRMVVSLAMTPARPRFELWFIWALALFFIAARLCARLPLTPQLAIAACFTVFWFSNLIPAGNLGWNGVPKYYLFFLIGIHYRSVLLDFAARLSRTTSLLVLLGWVALATGAYRSGALYFPGIGLAVRLIGLAAGIALAVTLQDVPFLRYLGSRTLQIYLAHTPLIIVFVWLIDLGIRRDPSAAWIADVKWELPIVLAVPAVGVALLLHELLAPTRAYVFYEPPRSASSTVWGLVRAQETTSSCRHRAPGRFASYRA